MGFRKIVVETKFRRASLLSTAMISRKARRRGLKRLQDVWRGWSEGDILNLKERLAHSGPHSGGIVQLTVREYRALAELNRRDTAANPARPVSPLLLWVAGIGLVSAIKT